MNKIFIDQNKHQKTITILLCILIVSIIKLKNLVIQHTVWNNFKASVSLPDPRFVFLGSKTPNPEGPLEPYSTN